MFIQVDKKKLKETLIDSVSLIELVKGENFLFYFVCLSILSLQSEKTKDKFWPLADRI